MLPCNGLALG